jgi:hypothetical protein
MNAGGVPYTCKSSEACSNTQSSGERVSNTWITCPEVGDNPGKLGLIPHDTERSKGARKGSRHWRGPRPIS